MTLSTDELDWDVSPEFPLKLNKSVAIRRGRKVERTEKKSLVMRLPQAMATSFRRPREGVICLL